MLNKKIKMYNLERHHRRSIRLTNYDYSSSGLYYVTICSRNRECIFSKIINDNVGAGLAPAQYELTIIGQIIKSNWISITTHYDNVDIGEFIIMPNHIHGIIEIRNGATNRVPAKGTPTLGNIVGSFKSKCVNEYLKYIKDNDLNDIAKIWQRNYYEEIIRDDKSLQRITEYIRNNPQNWCFDTEII